MKSVFSLIALSALAVAAHAQSFTDGFENSTFSTTATGGTITSGSTVWTVVNASSPVGINSWFDGNPTVFGAHAGTRYAGANFNSAAGAGTIDNFLMTPTLLLSNGDTFSFWTKTPSTTFPDRLYVKLSVSGASTSAASFTQTLLSVNPDLGTDYPTDWTRYTVTLSGLAAPVSGRLAFNYNVPDGGPSGDNSNYIGIDDVAYTAAPVPEPASMAALGLGAAAMLRRRKKA